MKTRLALSPYPMVVLLAGLLPAVAVAAAEPAVVLQVKPLEELRATVRQAAKNFLPAPVLKELERTAFGQMDLAALKGVDPKKPLGVYLSLADGPKKGDLLNSAVVVLVPVSDQSALLELLGGLGFRPEKTGDEYAVTIPNVPAPASLRFVKGYACLRLPKAGPGALALLDPQSVFNDKEAAAAALRVRFDLFPSELRKQYVAAYLRDNAARIKAAQETLGPSDDPRQRIRVATSVATTRRMGQLIASVVGEGRELDLRVDLDPKSGVATGELTLEALPGSDFAKSIRQIPRTENPFRRLVAAESAGYVLFEVPLFLGDLREAFSGAVQSLDAAVRQESKDEPKGSRQVGLGLAKALTRTAKEDPVGLAVSLRGPDDSGRFTAVGAVTLKDSAELEKALQAMAQGSAEFAGLVKPDAFHVRGVNVHELAVGPRLAPEARSVFGAGPAYAAFAPGAVYGTLGPRGKEVMTEILSEELRAEPAPLVEARISGKRTLALFKLLGAAPEAFPFLEKLTAAEQSTVLTVRVAGGEKFVLRVDVGLPALWVVAPKPGK